MKKKIILGIATGVLLVTLGVFYSCSYYASKTSPSLVTGLSGGNANDNIEKNTDDINENEVANNIGANNTGANNKAAINNSSGKSAADFTDNIADYKLYVHICGAVIDPGVYEIEAGARLVDLIVLAGGLDDDAAEDYINQAKTVTDGQRIYIPTRQELEELSPDVYILGEADEDDDVQKTETLTNINKADADDLMALPGIGQAKANSIIAYRNKNGEFKNIDEIMKIPGIKEGLFNQISTSITVD